MSRHPVTWSREDTFKLIELCKANSILWDVRRSDHKDRDKRYAVFNSIATLFGTTHAEVNRKFHNLKGQFYQELRRSMFKGHGEGYGENFVSSWCYYNALKFLDYGEKESPVPAGLETNQTWQQNDSSQPVYVISESESYEASDAPQPKRHKYDHTLNAKKQPEFYNYIPENTRDDDQIFGDYVAAALRNLESPRNKKRLQILIQKNIVAIQEADGELLDGGDVNGSENQNWAAMMEGVVKSEKGYSDDVQ